MFERNRVEHQGEAQRKAHLVEVTLGDGRVLKGRIQVSVSKTLADELNGPSSFIEFLAISGERTLLAKGCIATVVNFEAPRADQLGMALRQAEGLDAHQVLGIERGASYEEIRAAYHRLAKTYHPDRFAASELPKEMADYVSAMARRLNLAYSLLQDEVRPFTQPAPLNRARH